MTETSDTTPETALTENLDALVAELLTHRRLTVATAESCTGGLLSKRLTDTPGASAYFAGGVIAYSARVKSSLLGVDPGLIAEKGVVCREVALAMADGVRIKLGADIGLGTTGLAGPDGDGSDLAPGTVFVALSAAGASHCLELHLDFDRGGVRDAASSHALEMLRLYLLAL